MAQTLYFFLPAYLANMAPVFARGHFEWAAAPIDAGRSWRGCRILGDHKTWRGVVSGVVAGAFGFALQCWLYRAGFARDLALMDYGSVDPILSGVLLGLGTGIGDAIKSFFKRRVGIPAGASWLGFDQLDFMAGAYALVSFTFVPPPLATLAILPIVFFGSLASTTTGYWLGLKESWI